MKRALTWIATLVVMCGAGVGFYFAYHEARKERALESDREKPIDAPPKVSRTKEGGLAVSLDLEERQRSGVKLLVLEETAAPREMTGYGQVLNPAPMITLQRELASNEASLAALRSEYERLKTLNQEGDNASRRALEAAEAQLRTEENRSRAASRQIANEWGEALLPLRPEEREALLDRLARRETALVRINLLPGETPPGLPLGARILVVGDAEHSVFADRVYDAPVVDPKAQGQGFLLRVDHPGQSLRPGAAVIAHLQLPGEELKGVVIPRPAVVWFAGKAWAYTKLDALRFTRREVTLDRPAAQGWFSLSGLKQGDEIVVEGAQMLLSEELKPQIHVAVD